MPARPHTHTRYSFRSVKILQTEISREDHHLVEEAVEKAVKEAVEKAVKEAVEEACLGSC